MSCCGKARAQAQRAISNQPAKLAPGVAVQRKPPLPQNQPAAATNVYFSYFGNTGLTVTGPVSSRVYRFVASGPPLEVDARDAASLARVPNLRRIQHI